MAAWLRTKRLRIPATAVPLAMLGSLLSWSPILDANRPVFAHCPGGAEVSAYASGGQSVQGQSAWADSIEGWIGYTNPNVCTNTNGNAVTFQFVNICREGTCDGWVQAGWMKLQGWSAPRYYCEWHEKAGSPLNPSNHLHWPGSNLSATTHKFGMYFSGTSEWECKVDGSLVLHTHTAADLGFTQGWWMTAEGETHATHGQIGVNAPGKLGYTVLRYHKKASVWANSALGLLPVNAPYGSDIPASAEFRNWTNAH